MPQSAWLLRMVTCPREGEQEGLYILSAAEQRVYKLRSISIHDRVTRCMEVPMLKQMVH
jgi:hypothetical protein